MGPTLSFTRSRLHRPRRNTLISPGEEEVSCNEEEGSASCTARGGSWAQQRLTGVPKSIICGWSFAMSTEDHLRIKEGP